MAQVLLQLANLMDRPNPSMITHEPFLSSSATFVYEGQLWRLREHLKHSVLPFHLIHKFTLPSSYTFCLEQQLRRRWRQQPRGVEHLISSDLRWIEYGGSNSDCGSSRIIDSPPACSCISVEVLSLSCVKNGIDNSRSFMGRKQSTNVSCLYGGHGGQELLEEAEERSRDHDC
ncbi:hypothetical protein Drorol1_Dr00000282 [Drosera rotundifolia]